MPAFLRERANFTSGKIYAGAFSQPGTLRIECGMASRIKTLRKSRGWTQTDVAERAGVRVATVSKAERKPMDVEVETMSLIAQALGVTMADLFEPDQQPHPADRLRDIARQLPPEDVETLLKLAQGLRRNAG